MSENEEKSLDPLLALSPLLPCPFCGNDQPHVQSDLDNCVSMVVCGHCGASSDWNDSPEESVSAWNTRAANARGDDLPDGMVLVPHESLRYLAYATRGMQVCCGHGQQVSEDEIACCGQPVDAGEELGKILQAALTTTPESN